MDLFSLLLGAGAVVLLIRNAKEEQQRKSTPCYFSGDVTREDFERIVSQSKGKIKRLAELTVDGTVVRGIVHSQSGITDWSFSIDFNDYGRISGKYWISTDNYDSKIPEKVAEIIKGEILNCQKLKREA